RGLPEYHQGAIQVVASVEPGKPTSHAQVKSWLDTLGWVPQHFKYVKEPDGSQRKIPQISNEMGDGLCESIKILFSKEPVLMELDSLFIIAHRIGLLNGFLKNVDNKGYLT